MLKHFGLLALTVAALNSALAQAPSSETLALSARTMVKALAGCREALIRPAKGGKEALVKPLVGAGNYDKDMVSLHHAEDFARLLAEHPDRVSGRLLVALLSSSDDLSIGVGSTRFEVMRQMILNTAGPSNDSDLLFASEALNNCQQALFNAGDDYVDLVMSFVGAEDAMVLRKGK